MSVEQLTLLLIEDDLDYAMLIQQMLESQREMALLPSITWTHVRTLADAQRFLAHQNVELILLDLGLPDATELMAVEPVLRAAPNSAVVILTGLDRDDIVEQALHLGVEDYLVKGNFTTEGLSRSIRYGIGRRQAKNALFANERRFRSLIENASDVVVVLDDDGLILYASPSATTRLGYPMEEVIEQSVFDFIHEQDLEIMRARLADCLENGPRDASASASASEVRIRGQQGNWRTFNVTVTDLRHDPAVGGIVVNARDVTEQRAAEAVMHKAQRLESVGLLAGGMAHDFNNLLTIIAAQNALALAKLPADSGARSHINNATRTIGAAARLTRQLLDYAGRGGVQLEAVDVSTFLTEGSGWISATMPKNIRLRLDLSQNLPTVDIDPAQLQQILLNIVVNAVDAIGTSGGAITVTTETAHLARGQLDTYLLGPDRAPGDYVKVQVMDTGAGMDEAVVHQIFDPFYSTKAAGHGLGLAAVLGILRAAGGAIRVHSQPAHGTTFTVLLPAGQLTPAPVKYSPRRLTSAPLGTVLVVEDESGLRDGLSELLATVGLNALTAANGSQGLELYAANRAEIGAIFLDLRMPEMDGRAMLAHLREIDRDVEVLVSSAFYDANNLQDVLEQPHTIFVPKPFDVERVVSYLATAVDRHNSRGILH